MRIALPPAVTMLVVLATVTAPGSDGPASIDARGRRVLRRASAAIEALQRFRVDLSHEMKTAGPFGDQAVTTRYDFAIERPNRLALRLQRGAGGASVISDGRDMVMHVPEIRQYTETEAPATLAALRDAGPSITGALMGLELLLAEDPYERLMPAIRALDYVGIETIDQAEYDRLALRLDPSALAKGQSVPQVKEVPVDIWIGRADPPLLRRIVPDLSPMLAAMAASASNPQQAAMLRQMKMHIDIQFRDWRTDEPLPGGHFDFVAPDGAQRVDRFGPPTGGAPEQHPLEGRAAPTFELADLDGGKVHLAGHKGRDVVILDFWAIWCGPCVRALPVLQKVAGAYRDRAVAFYAVNLGDGPDRIRQFMKARDLEFPVALDQDGAVANAYGVVGIPQTVIVGRDGIVRKVHVGLPPNLENALRGELDAILAEDADASAGAR